jgi:putative ABC transport system substrate-binding protein
VKRLRELGWVEGENLRLEVRGHPTLDGMTELATEFVRANVDVIYAPNSPQVEAASRSTKTIPIIFSAHGDPVGAGHVTSLSHPGGNITGLTNMLTELSAKALDVLREAIPDIKQIGVVWDPTSPAAGVASVNVAETAANMGLQVHKAPVRSADVFDTALQALAQANVGAFVAINSPLTFNRRAELAEAALKYRLASMSSAKDIAEEGALLSYASDLEYLTSHAADYVDKILRGAKPADLPVEQVSKYLLVINLKTAKALGLTIPPSLLARADEVIE